MKMKHEMRGENDRSQVKAERTCIYKLDADPTLENSTPLKGASYHHIFIYFFFLLYEGLSDLVSVLDHHGPFPELR